MDDDDDDVEGAPFFNITRYMSDDRRSFIAFTAGFLGSIAYGGSLYGVWNIDPFLGGNLKLLAGMDVLQYRTDDQLSDLQEEVFASEAEGQLAKNDPIARWDFDDEITVAPRIGLLWQF